MKKAEVRAHIVPLRESGAVVSYQVRAGKGGPGLSRAFAVRKHDGQANALKAAQRFAKQSGWVVGEHRRGLEKGQPNKRSRTSAAGIRFEWIDYSTVSVLYVIATWTDATGRARAARRSTAVHGLEGALDVVIDLRVKSGAPKPDRQRLLNELRAAYVGFQRTAHD